MTVVDVRVPPATSVAMTRRSYSTSAKVVVSHAQEYEDDVSVQIVVQVDVPAGARWNSTDAMPEPASVAVAFSVTVPETVAAGAVSDAVAGTVLSIRLATVADVVASAAPSVAIARTSIRPSANVPVAAEQVKGAALAVQKSVQRRRRA